MTITYSTNFYCFQSAEISIKVHGKGLFGLEDFIGACENMHVKDLLEQGEVMMIIVVSTLPNEQLE
jgi:hypothetical protein